MNLAEFPLAVLSTRVDTKTKTLEFRDTIKGRNGEVTTREWIITAADKFGLPTASDDEVFLGLLKLCVDDGFKSQKVYFTRYELLKILRWTTEGRSYRRLQGALDRLSGVRIKATNAFYDNEIKQNSTRNFGILDGYELNDGRNVEPKPSFFTWSDVMFKSFQAGFIKKLDLDFFLTLKSSVSKRLYRYLDKHFWYRASVRQNLFVLAHEKIGISRNYRYASSLKQQLDPAFGELIARGFLASVSYEGRGEGTEVIISAKSARPRSIKLSETSEKQLNVDQPQEPEDRVVELLIARGINPKQASQLVVGRSPSIIQRVVQIIEYFDQLVGAGSPLISRSPAGFLYRAVERPEAFVLPGERRVEQATLQFQSGDDQLRKNQPDSGARGGRAKPMPLIERERKLAQATQNETEYLTARKIAIGEYRRKTPRGALIELTQEVEQALSKIKGVIGEENFKRAIEHGVDERIAKLHAYPDFDDWQRLQRQES